MKEVKKDMILIYNTTEYDWMNYKIDEEDVITFHHIIKKENGGEYTLDNGALLTERAHSHLHFIEQVDKEIYDRINEVFLDINNQMCEPNYIQRNMIELLLMKFEIENADRIISKKEDVHPRKKRILLAYQRRVDSQKHVF